MTAPIPLAPRLTAARRVALASLVAAAIAAPAAACQLLAGIEPVDQVPASTTGSTADSGSTDAAHDAPAQADAAPDAPAFDPCGASTAFPESPPASAFPGNIDITTVMRRAFLGSSAVPDAVAPLVCRASSFDLDGVYTCKGPKDVGSPAGSPCAAYKPSTQNTCDLAEGRDNATTALLVASVEQVGHEPSWLDGRIEKGELGMMFQIASYNGEPDDDHVTVTVLLLFGPERDADGGVDGGEDAAPPSWQPSDRWAVNGASCKDPATCKVPTFTGTGYVRDQWLYASLDDLGLPIMVEYVRLVVPAKGARLTAHLAPPGDAGGWAMDHARLAGRVQTTAMAEQFGSIEVNGKPLCEQPLALPMIRDAVCRYADLPLDALDAPDAATICSALSFSLGFFTVPGRRGRVIDPGPPSTACAGAAIATCY